MTWILGTIAVIAVLAIGGSPLVLRRRGAGGDPSARAAAGVHTSTSEGVAQALRTRRNTPGG